MTIQFDVAGSGGLNLMPGHHGLGRALKSPALTRYPPVRVGLFGRGAGVHH